MGSSVCCSFGFAVADDSAPPAPGKYTAKRQRGQGEPDDTEPTACASNSTGSGESGKSYAEAIRSRGN